MHIQQLHFGTCMETWYSRGGKIERHERTAIAYTVIRPGVDDHAASEFIKIEEQQGDLAMQFLLDAKARYDKQEVRHMFFEF